MVIKIKNIKLIFEKELDFSEPIGAEVDYNLILNNIPKPETYVKDNVVIELPDSSLTGKILIMNGPNVSVANMQLWEFNKHIFQKVVTSI